MKPSIAIIVPIYGTEKYLEECLVSIRNQSFKNIEIICVDDCSPDDSYLIVNKHAEEDSRVSLIRHEENKGLGGARNTGILAAQAEFITGVDSDDTIKVDMIKQLWEASEEGIYDVVCAGYDRVDENGELISSQLFSPNIIININDSINIFSIFNPSFCNKLWRRSLYVENNIYFPEHMYFEDMATTPRLMTNVKNIKIIESSVYNYFQRNGSITSTYSSKHIVDYFKAYELILNYLIEKKLYGHYLNPFKEYVDSGMRFHSECVVKSSMSDEKIDQYLRHLLMLKISFLETHNFLITKKREELLMFLKSAHFVNDFFPEKSVSESCSSSVESTKPLGSFDDSNELTIVQKIGARMFGFLFRGFINQKHRHKLKNNPEMFFKDSKNKLTRKVGSVLKIIN